MAVATDRTVTLAGERRRPKWFGSRLSLRRRVFIATYVVSVTTLVLAIASVLALRSSDSWVDRRRVVLVPAAAQVDRLSLALLDQQNGSRGYILSSDPTFLDSYESGRQAERDAVARLRTLMGDDPVVMAQLENVLDKSEQWHDEIVVPQIALVEAGRPEEAAQIVESGAGRTAFDDIRAELEVLGDDLEERLDAGGVRLDQWIGVLGVLAIAGAAVSGVATLAVWVALRRGLTRPLERLSLEAAAVAGGRLDTSITPGGPVEVDAVAHSVEQMRRMLLGEISASFNQGMAEAEQLERARLAGELHDDPIQALSAAQWRLEAMLPQIDDPQRGSLEGVAASLGDVQMRLRDLMFELHPPSLDHEGLTVALEDLLDETFGGTDVETHLVSDLDERVPSVMSGLVYRLIAEAVRNARRHAAPRHVTVTARFDRGIRVDVIDDGDGFDGAPALRPGHGGTQIGAAMAAAAGGWWHVSSRPRPTHPDDHGTTVSFWLPMDRSSDASASDEIGPA